VRSDPQLAIVGSEVKQNFQQLALKLRVEVDLRFIDKEDRIIVGNRLNWVFGNERGAVAGSADA
jgi:hypothetical protein